MNAHIRYASYINFLCKSIHKKLIYLDYELQNLLRMCRDKTTPVQAMCSGVCETPTTSNQRWYVEPNRAVGKHTTAIRSAERRGCSVGGWLHGGRGIIQDQQLRLLQHRNPPSERRTVGAASAPLWRHHSTESKARSTRRWHMAVNLRVALRRATRARSHSRGIALYDRKAQGANPCSVNGRCWS
jgi:hypothetical protein